MSGNTSFSNDSILNPPVSFMGFSTYLKCFIIPPSSYLCTALSIIKIILILPLSIFVLYLGFQKWQLKRSSSSAAAITHSDCFTYHVAAINCLGVFGNMLSVCGIYAENVFMVSVGSLIYSLTWYGQIFFHVFTCVERYMAVVHPLTYLGLRNERGVRLRSVGSGCAWLLSAAGMFLVISDNIFIILDIGLLVLSLSVICYCSLLVLCVLTRPSPGEQGTRRGRVDPTKRRALNTIVSLLAVLLLRFASNLSWTVFHLSGKYEECVVLVSSILFNLPCSMALPVLYLHRHGNLRFCKGNV